MADIELIIKIPKELYEAYKGRPPMLGDTGMDMIAQSIANGTPVPKGHDRLIEAKRLKEVFRRNTGYDYHDLIDIAPTIIEADKESDK